MENMSLDFKLGYELGLTVGFFIAAVGIPLAILFLIHVSDAIRDYGRDS